MFKLKLKTANAAFEGDNAGPEIARILRDLAASVLAADLSVDAGWKLRDINGNTVGEAYFDAP